MGGVRHGLVSEDPSGFSYAAEVESHPQSPKGSTSGIVHVCPGDLHKMKTLALEIKGVGACQWLCAVWRLICDGHIFSFE